MTPTAITCNGKNFLVQRTFTNPNMVTVRIDESFRERASKMALLVYDNNIWYFSLEENLPFWKRGNNKFRSQADTHEQCFNDLLAYIRGN